MPITNRIAGQPGVKAWCILVYACGANEMEPEIIGSLAQMESVIIPPDITVVVQVARAPRELVKKLRPGLSSYEIDSGWHGVRRYVIKPRPPGWPHNKIYSSPLAHQENPNTSSPATLYGFIQWGMTNFPARHYMVILSGHGAGFFGALTDYTHGCPYIMSIPGLVGALCLAARHSGKKIDLLALDTCYMNMAEVLYELSVTRAASHLLVPVSAAPLTGFPYDILLNTMGNLTEKKDIRQFAAGVAAAVNAQWRKNGFRLCPVDLKPRYHRKIKQAANLLAACELLLSPKDRPCYGYFSRWQLKLLGQIKAISEKYLRRSLKAPVIHVISKKTTISLHLIIEAFKHLLQLNGSPINSSPIIPGETDLTLYTPEDIEEYSCYSRYYENLLFTLENLWVNKISGRPVAQQINPWHTRKKYLREILFPPPINKNLEHLPGPQYIPRELLINSLLDINPGYDSRFFEEIVNTLEWYPFYVESI